MQRVSLKLKNIKSIYNIKIFTDIFFIMYNLLKGRSRLNFMIINDCTHVLIILIYLFTGGVSLYLTNSSLVHGL